MAAKKTAARKRKKKNPADTQFKPGNRYRWRPGDCPNPGGKPSPLTKARKSFRLAAADILGAISPDGVRTYFEALMQGYIQQMFMRTYPMRGKQKFAMLDIKAFTEMRDMVEGSPKQSIEITGPENPDAIEGLGAADMLDRTAGIVRVRERLAAAKAKAEADMAELAQEQQGEDEKV